MIQGRGKGPRREGEQGEGWGKKKGKRCSEKRTKKDEEGEGGGEEKENIRTK